VGSRSESSGGAPPRSLAAPPSSRLGGKGICLGRWMSSGRSRLELGGVLLREKSCPLDGRWTDQISDQQGRFLVMGSRSKGSCRDKAGYDTLITSQIEVLCRSLCC
jgi:hypothetical protein